MVDTRELAGIDYKGGLWNNFLLNFLIGIFLSSLTYTGFGLIYMGFSLVKLGDGNCRVYCPELSCNFLLFINYFMVIFLTLVPIYFCCSSVSLSSNSS